MKYLMDLVDRVMLRHSIEPEHKHVFDTDLGVTAVTPDFYTLRCTCGQLALVRRARRCA